MTDFIEKPIYFEDLAFVVLLVALYVLFSICFQLVAELGLFVDHLLNFIQLKGVFSDTRNRLDIYSLLNKVLCAGRTHSSGLVALFPDSEKVEDFLAPVLNAVLCAKEVQFGVKFKALALD